MSKRRRVFDIDLPADLPDDAPGEGGFPRGEIDSGSMPAELETKSARPARRGPMATAIGETGAALRHRKQVEAEIRAENDALAHEFVRLKKLGLVTDLIPLDRIRTGLLTRDRGLTVDLALDDLKASLREIGLSNPIRVVSDGAGGYELVQGLRRLTAYRELLAETGEDRWATIPAGLMAPGETLDILYRRMVDENLVRKDISFGEMANLARAYADDGVEGCADVDEAVNRLFASAGPQKRSYVRRFAFLMQMLEKHLNFATAIPRALGLQLADWIEGNPEALRRLVTMLRDASPIVADQELAVLRSFLGEQGNAPPARVRGAPRGGNRRGRMTLAVPLGAGPRGGVRATATAGKVELRADLDFTTLDRRRLEAAIEAFFAALGRS